MRGLALLKATRPHNGIACAILVAVGLFQGGERDPVNGVVAAAAVFLLCCAAHLVNDILDLAADRANRPSRPLVAGSLSLSDARVAAAVAWVSGLALGLILIPEWWFWWLFWGCAGPGYSFLAKGHGWIAPIWTAAVIGSCHLAGSMTDGVGVIDALYFVAISYFILFRELVKGVEDTDGDLNAGYRTLSSSNLLQWRGLLLLALPLLGSGIAVARYGSSGRFGQVVGIIFLLLLSTAVVTIRSRRLRTRHLPGALLKISGFCGLTLLWGLVT